jgi:D-amino-acid dehydrogenase
MLRCSIRGPTNYSNSDTIKAIFIHFINSLRMSRRKKNHICVVGSGIVGICTALHLIRKNWDVTIIDPNGPASKASSGNAGLIAVGHVTPISSPSILKEVPRMIVDPNSSLVIRYTYLPNLIPWLFRFVLAGRPKQYIKNCNSLSELLKETYSAYEPLINEADCNDFMKRQGLIVALTSDEALEKIQPEILLKKSLGIRIKIFDQKQIQSILPKLDNSVRHAVYYEDVSHVTDPYKFSLRLFEDFKNKGGKFLHKKAQDFITYKNRIKSIVIEDGEIQVDSIVICAGAWSKILASKLGSNVPLETERGYSVSLPNPGIKLDYPVISGELRFCATPMGKSIRLAGTVELAKIDDPPNEKRYELIIKHALKLFPSLKLSGASYWMGHRPSLPDSLPVIGRSPIFENGFFAFGHGHIGLTTAAATGKLIYELASDLETSIDLKPFSVDRF